LTQFDVVIDPIALDDLGLNLDSNVRRDIRFKSSRDRASNDDSFAMDTLRSHLLSTLESIDLTIGICFGRLSISGDILCRASKGKCIVDRSCRSESCG